MIPISCIVRVYIRIISFDGHIKLCDICWIFDEHIETLDAEMKRSWNYIVCRRAHAAAIKGFAQLSARGSALSLLGAFQLQVPPNLAK